MVAVAGERIVLVFVLERLFGAAQAPFPNLRWLILQRMHQTGVVGIVGIQRGKLLRL